MHRCLFLLIFSAELLANPWGKDADLAIPHLTQEPANPISTPIVGGISESLIAFHQNVISPADGPRSHFKPSSSNYTLESMRKYGFFQGFAMGCDRLMRENSEEWVYRKHPEGLKWDPVP